MEVEEAVLLLGEAEEHCTLGELAPHNAFASWHLTSPFPIFLQGPVVSVVPSDWIRRHKAVVPFFLFPQVDNLLRYPLPFV